MGAWDDRLHGSGRPRFALRFDGLRQKPVGLEYAKLPNSVLRDLITPLRNRAWRDFEQLGQGGCIAGLADCMFRFHGNEFSTLNN